MNDEINQSKFKNINIPKKKQSRKKSSLNARSFAWIVNNWQRLNVSFWIRFEFNTINFRFSSWWNFFWVLILTVLNFSCTLIAKSMEHSSKIEQSMHKAWIGMEKGGMKFRMEKLILIYVRRNERGKTNAAKTP